MCSMVLLAAAKELYYQPVMERVVDIIYLSIGRKIEIVIIF